MSHLKNQIRDAYDKIAPAYEEWALKRTELRTSHVEKILQHLSDHSHVLELGCGAGLPVTKLLASRVQVTANDISETMISTAQRQVSGVNYKCCDMMTLDFPAESFDAVVAMYSIIHLPHEEQKAVLSRIHSWLKVGGSLLLNLGAHQDPGSWGEWFGMQMFWSSFGAAKSREMVVEAGFRLDKAEAIPEPVDDMEDPDYRVSFVWIIAKKMEK